MNLVAEAEELLLEFFKAEIGTAHAVGLLAHKFYQALHAEILVGGVEHFGGSVGEQQ